MKWLKRDLCCDYPHCVCVGGGSTAHFHSPVVGTEATSSKTIASLSIIDRPQHAKKKKTFPLPEKKKKEERKEAAGSSETNNHPQPK